MNGKIRFGSVCSGIEAASVAWHPLGWEAAWLSEIEPFPCAVLKHHYPQVPNLGDMTLLPNRIASGEVEAPDVFCGGTPCQAFSVAGLRQSLDDSRGNLSLIFCEIANAIDNIRLIQQSSPAIIFWENVPGVLNTKDNAFGCFLAGLAGESDALIPSGGRWTDAGFIDGPKRAVAWRVLDAQYFGLAQRRKRVFVIASARDDFDPAEVLFEFDGVRRDIAPSRETRKEVATDAIPSIANCLETTCNDYSRADGFNMICTDITGPLTARDYKGISSDDCNPTMMKLIAYENHPADSRVKEMGETCTTVTSRWGTGGGNVPLVQAFDSYNLSLSDVNQTIKSPSGGTLESVGGIVQAIAFEPGIAKREGGDSRFTEEFSPTLRKEMGDNQVAVAYSIREDAKANTFSATELNVANSIGALQPSPQSHHAQVFVAQPIVLEDQGGSVINTSQTGIVGTLRRETHGHEPSIVTTAVDTYNLTLSKESTQTLRGNGHIDHVGGVMQQMAVDTYNGTIQGDVTATMTADMAGPTHSGPKVMHPISFDSYNQSVSNVTHTLRVGRGADELPMTITQMAVRRLTPVECERLQGFPDNYTNIPKAADGNRYKALGNSMAVPVMRWIGERINQYEQRGMEKHL
jgi:DNA (cytosine-5)-methyltransferase 1